MMADRRKRFAIFLFLFLLLVLLMGWLLWALFHKDPPVVVELADAPAQEQPTIPKEPEVNPISEQKKDERIATSSVSTIAKTFTERYGSYSNEANFQNLRDVLPLMSIELRAQTQTFIDTATAPANYYGVTTRVITVDVQSIDETLGTATLELTTQREEALESPEKTKISYQKIRLELVQEEGTWKIASVTWL